MPADSKECMLERSSLDKASAYLQSVIFSQKLDWYYGTSNLDKALFLHQHAMRHNSQFQRQLKDMFEKQEYVLEGNLKSDLQRIACKITEANENPFRITDMIRATIIVKEPQQLVDAYNTIASNSEFNIIRLKNNLKDPLMHVHLNVIFNQSIIGEILIRCGPKPINYEATKFFTGLKSARSIE